jgi:hypothetical protein
MPVGETMMPVGETMMPVGETMMPVGEKMMTVGENPERASRLWLAAPFFSRTRLNRFKTSAYVKNVLSVRATQTGLMGWGLRNAPPANKRRRLTHSSEAGRHSSETVHRK